MSVPSHWNIAAQLSSESATGCTSDVLIDGTVWFNEQATSYRERLKIPDTKAATHRIHGVADLHIDTCQRVPELWSGGEPVAEFVEIDGT
jgi:hypothetical protein